MSDKQKSITTLMSTSRINCVIKWSIRLIIIAVFNVVTIQVMHAADWAYGSNGHFTIINKSNHYLTFDFYNPKYDNTDYHQDTVYSSLTFGNAGFMGSTLYCWHYSYSFDNSITDGNYIELLNKYKNNLGYIYETWDKDKSYSYNLSTHSDLLIASDSFKNHNYNDSKDAHRFCVNGTISYYGVGVYDQTISENKAFKDFSDWKGADSDGNDYELQLDPVNHVAQFIGGGNSQMTDYKFLDGYINFFNATQGEIKVHGLRVNISKGNATLELYNTTGETSIAILKKS
jgi:hypothetical protein